MGQDRADGMCVAPLNGTAVVGSPTGAPGGGWSLGEKKTTHQRETLDAVMR